MATATLGNIFATEIWSAKGAALWVKRFVLVTLGVLALAMSQQISVTFWPTSVPVTLGALALLTVGVAYGPRLGLVTILTYLVIGAIGFDVLARFGLPTFGWTFGAIGLGGNLAGFMLATSLFAMVARNGWDRELPKLALATIIGFVLVYLPGALWLAHFNGWQVSLEFWTTIPVHVADVAKVALAVVLIPLTWRLVGKSRN